MNAAMLTWQRNLPTALMTHSSATVCRGNYVLIDHGYGIYSGYAHLGTMHVTRGQDVTRNQVLGTVGDTGRVSGPHFHWEMAVNGNWVDSVQFIQLWMP
ncbi:M23 family metallopeptidase [Leptolyngbya sp. 15MV]|nr:M23 family metallopeptidase [Leptolyngbya sp. 15MV]